MINRILLFAVGLALVAVPARSAQITFTTLPPTVENGTFNGFLGATLDGIYVNIVCDDFYSPTYVPSGPWEYNVSTLPTLTFARFGSDDAAKLRYAVAAVLLGGDGGALAGLANVVDPHAISSYQYALWTLFTPSVSSYGDSASLLNTAQNAVLNPTLATLASGQYLRIYTPSVSAASNQEFLGLNTDIELIATPEPGTTILMGIGFLLLSIVGRKFTRVTDEHKTSRK